MLKILGEFYYVDLDMIDEYTSIKEENNTDTESEDEEIGSKVHLVKFEMLKFMLDVIMDNPDEVDEKLAGSSTELSIPFKLAFNTLLNKKIINKF